MADHNKNTVVVPPQMIPIPDLSKPIEAVGNAIATTRENIPDLSELDNVTDDVGAMNIKPAVEGFEADLIPDLSSQVDPESLLSNQLGFNTNLVPDLSLNSEQPPDQDVGSKNLAPDTSLSIEATRAKNFAKPKLDMSKTIGEEIDADDGTIVTNPTLDPFLVESVTQPMDDTTVADNLVPNLGSNIEFPLDTIDPIPSIDQVTGSSVTTTIPDLDELEEVRSSQGNKNSKIQFIGRPTIRPLPFGSRIQPSVNILPTLNQIKDELNNIYNDDDDDSSKNSVDDNLYDYVEEGGIHQLQRPGSLLHQIPVEPLLLSPLPTSPPTAPMQISKESDKLVFHKIPILSTPSPTPSSSGGSLSPGDTVPSQPSAMNIFLSSRFQTSFGQDQSPNQIEPNPHVAGEGPMAGLGGPVPVNQALATQSNNNSQTLMDSLSKGIGKSLYIDILFLRLQQFVLKLLYVLISQASRLSGDLFLEV